MPLRRCRVTFKDPDGTVHGVEVHASSLYEAAALALAEFRREGWIEEALAPTATLEVVVLTPPVSHVVKVSAVERWLASPARNPKEQLLKESVRPKTTH